MMRAASNLSLSGQWAPKSVTVALKMEIVLLDDQNIKGHKGQALHGSFQIWPIPRSVPACCLPGKPRINEPGYLFHKAQLGLEIFEIIRLLHISIFPMRLEGPSILRIELLEELLIHFAQVKTAGIQPRKEERYLNYRIMDTYIYIYIS